MDQEIHEVAVEMNAIFDNMSEDILSKIPLKLRKLFKENASTTYNFKYDKTKSLNEQNIKDKTRGVIAFLYRDYICDENERNEYNEIYSKFLREEEEKKRTLYNPNDIFKKANTKNTQKNENINLTEMTNTKTNFIQKLFSSILNIFKR